MQVLRQAIEEQDWERMADVLDRMSNMEFRHAETFVRQDVLPTLKNDEMWDAIFHLVNYRRQAFLSCVLAFEDSAGQETLDFTCNGAQELANTLRKDHPESLSKVVNMCLPLLKTTEQIEGLLETFETGKETNNIAALLKVESPLCYYTLFEHLRRIPENKPLASDCTRYIMKRGNDMAYNMAAIMKAYFGLDDIRGRFSLHIEPYELSMLDNSKDAFYHLLHGRRPQVEM